MGVVRREGAWRLEKIGEGHYELTHNREVQATILTPDYEQGAIGGVGFGFNTVHEVDSYAEAEGIFEERAHRGSSPGSNSIGNWSATSSSGGNGGFDLGWEGGESSQPDRTDDGFIEEAGELPPGGIALVLVLSGGLFMWIYGFAPGELPFQFASLMALAGTLIFVWAAVIYQQDGWRAAFDFLATLDDNSQSGDNDKQEKDTSKTTGAVPKQRKRELIFDRAGQQCEWCDTDLDNPEVHHIKPRRDGGSNEPSNLIVLCPTCHSKADKGGISRSMLREKLRHIRSQKH